MGFVVPLTGFGSVDHETWVFPDGSDSKESTRNARDLGLIPGLGRSLGEGKGYSLQDFLVWRIPWASPWGCKELDMTERLLLHFI